MKDVDLAKPEVVHYIVTVRLHMSKKTGTELSHPS